MKRMFQKNKGNIIREMYLILPAIVGTSANRYFNDIRLINVYFVITTMIDSRMNDDAIRSFNNFNKQLNIFK